MSIYLIRSGFTGPVKIGVSAAPAARLKTLQTSHPVPLRIIRLLKGGPTDERVFHVRFAGHRQVGEWFSLDPEMMNFGGAMRDLPVTLPKRGYPHPDAAQWRKAAFAAPLDTIAAILKALGGAGVIGAELSVSANTVTYWAHRERIPVEHFDGLVALAAKRDVVGVDHAILAKACRARKPRSVVQAA